MSSLRGRLARFYAIAIALVLLAFGATVWAIMEAEEAAEPPQVRALEPPEAWPRRLAIALLTALPVAIAVAAGGAVVIARRGLRPLEDVIATAASVSTEALDRRIAEPQQAVDEIARLIHALNAMLERLERSVAGMRRFTADASHELRTPLASLMGELEVTLRRDRKPEELRATVEQTLESLGGLSRLVESLLALARADSGGLPIAPEPLDLATLARAAVEPYEPLLAARKIAIAWDAAQPVPVRADRAWTGRVIANLIDNALKFTPEGGEIRTIVKIVGERATLEVRDSGPGVPAAERERVFERFYRGEAARAGVPGVGLGLPLARDIARAQGGELRAADSDRGARFVLELPSAA
jgi:two-component system OmpR family sensor kinase